MHRLAALAEPVHVEDRDEVVELVVRRRARTPPTPSPRRSRCRRTASRPGTGSRSSRLPASAMPTAIGSPWPSEPVATSTQGIRGVGWPSRSSRTAGRSAAPRPRSRRRRGTSRTGASRRGPSRRRAGRCAGRAVEVVAQVLREQHRHQVGRGHARGGMAGPGRRGAADRIDPQLLSQLTPELGRRPCTCNVAVMKVAVAFDHRGVQLRERVLEELDGGHEIVDLGTDTDAVRIDYPDKAAELGDAVRTGRPSAACSSAAPASAPRSPRARSPGSGPPSVTTSTRRTRASSTTT